MNENTEVSSMKKRVVVLADLHCGHRLGLCPAQYHAGPPGSNPLWDWYISQAELLRAEGYVDLLVVNGDAIDGASPRSGGVELETSDRIAQVDMAAACLAPWRAKKIVLVHGTAYHTGQSEDWETILARFLGCDVHDEYRCSVEGTVFRFRHRGPISSLPAGRFNGLVRAQINDMLEWARDTENPHNRMADVYVQSHGHYWAHAQNAWWSMFATPCLQIGSKFGRNITAPSPDIGFLIFDCEAGNYSWQRRALKLTRGTRNPQLDEI